MDERESSLFVEILVSSPRDAAELILMYERQTVCVLDAGVQLFATEQECSVACWFAFFIIKEKELFQEFTIDLKRVTSDLLGGN